MAHKTLIGGTAYEIGGGKTLINGTGYSIDKGKTLVGGTAYDIGFSSGVIVEVTGAGYASSFNKGCYLEVSNLLFQKITSPCTLDIQDGTYITCYAQKSAFGSGAIYLNGEQVGTAIEGMAAHYEYTYYPQGNATINLEFVDDTSDYGIITITEH